MRYYTIIDIFQRSLSLNRVDRLVAIILLLQTSRNIRAMDIADHFEINIRTVYRDITALCEAGVPIIAEPGKGYSLMEGYHLPPVMFTQEEASALCLGGQFVEKLTDISMRENIHSAMLKIQSILPKDTQNYLSKLQQSTFLNLQSQNDMHGFSNDHHIQIQEAIIHQNVLSIEYFTNSRQTLSTRDIEPMGLIYYSNHWHLIAYCRVRESYRDFRMDRIKSMITTQNHFKKRMDFSIKNYLDGQIESKETMEAQILFKKCVVPYIHQQCSMGLINEQERDDGVLMTFLIPYEKWISSWLLSFGKSATVISPKSLREQLLKDAQTLVEHYKIL